MNPSSTGLRSPPQVNTSLATAIPVLSLFTDRFTASRESAISPRCVAHLQALLLTGYFYLKPTTRTENVIIDSSLLSPSLPSARPKRNSHPKAPVSKSTVASLQEPGCARIRVNSLPNPPTSESYRFMPVAALGMGSCWPAAPPDTFPVADLV